MPHYQGWKRNIILFLSGQAISLFGSSLVGFAIIWHITLTTKSGIMMTIATVCTFLPQLFISFFAGVWVDRYNRKLLIILADAGIAIVTLALAIIFLSGYQGLWLIFVMLALRSIGAGIQTPADGAILPQIVPSDKLMRINGMNGSLQSIIMLLSPMAGGALLMMMPLGTIFFIDVITAILAIGMLLIIPIKPHERSAEQQDTGHFEEIKRGIAYTKKNTFVREMLIMYLFYFLFITPAAFLSPLYIARVFGEEVWRLTANEIAFSVGMMLGGGIIAWWGGFKNGIYTIALSCLVIGITSILLAVHSFYVYLAMLLIMGIFVSFFSAVEMTLFQQKVETDMQGRVFSLVQIIATGVMPLGMLVLGPLSDVFPIEVQFVVSGILIVGLSFYIFLNKRLIKSAE
jgi:DHA3 family macrolide efflux protein-like MFS transporter